MLGRKRSLRHQFEAEALPYIEALYATAVRLTHNPREAEDLLQDTMLKAYRFFHRFQAGTNAKAWLFRILHNTFINRYRRRLREQKLLAEIEHGDACEMGRAPGSENPERSLLGKMLADDVQRALDEVPADFRMAIVLADLEDFSYREVAEIMDCPVGTVMSRLYRGRRILQRRLHDYAVAQGIIHEPQPAGRGEAAEVASLEDWRRRSQEGE